MYFSNRAEAARLLAERLAVYRGQHALVLGVPRGGVPMARLIADELDGDLDVVLVRKLRSPEQPELAIGAVDEHGHVVGGAFVAPATERYIEREIEIQVATLLRRRARYSGARPPLSPQGRLVIVVDDGVATGASMLAAIRSVRARKPTRLVLAVGVAPPSTLDLLRGEVDEVVCLHSTEAFMAVGQFYDDFSEVTDDMVVEALTR